MSRRMSLPGADELFRTTGAPAPAPTSPEKAAPEPLRAVPEPTAAPTASESLDEHAVTRPSGVRHTATRRRPRQAGDRVPSGRERHDEKITVYVSAEELMDLEHARLTLRGDHGMAVDRGRIVREALAVVIADLEAKGDASILVRRLRGH
ncbi:MAG: hypothetical protein JWN35_659 [Frankiales bacterium]|jgi:hypothetical protein|nr:hypothetical protein [Frankiales bacterium]